MTWSPRYQTKDQFTNRKHMQWAVSSSFNTFQATALSYDTGRPMLERHMPPWRQAKPYKIIEETSKSKLTTPLSELCLAILYTETIHDSAVKLALLLRVSLKWNWKNYRIRKGSTRPVALFAGILSRESSVHGHQISFPELCLAVQPRWSLACRALPGLQR